VFVTLFDLIPLLFPNLVPQSFQTTFQAYLNSIDQDTHILSISASAKQDLLRVRPDIKPTNIHVTPLAASEVFKPCDDPQKILLAKEKYGIPANSQYILSVSRNDPNKNLSTLIQAFHMAYQRIKDPNLMLVLAGSHGKSTFEVVNEASRLASQTPGVIRTGYIHEDDLPAIYSGALFFAFPSLYEGFGLPVLEAMQCGTPVISSNTSSLPEVTGGAGKLIEPLNIDAWVAAICELYEDKTLRMKMSLLSHEQAGLFSWQNTLDLTVAAYKEALHLQM
jgi:glycosyltransferase involved in cell wall biosynthesis